MSFQLVDTGDNLIGEVGCIQGSPETLAPCQVDIGNCGTSDCGWDSQRTWTP